MGVEIKSFNGKLNYDNSPYKLPSDDYIDAYNISRNNTLVPHNLSGNVLVTNSSLHGTGVNKVIGRHEDVTRNRIYYFVWNSDDYHLICYYDAGLDTIVKVLANLTDTGSVDILEFDPSYRINHVDIFYRDSEGDLLMFCAGNSSPKCLNVKSLINGVYTVVKKSFIEQAKPPFLTPPVAVYGTDTAKNSNALKRNLFQFSARPIFDNFQKATFSSYSKLALPIGFYGSDNDSVTSANNFITVTVETGDEDVASIEIAFRSNINSNWGDFSTAVVLNKAQLGIPDNTTYDFLFYNDAVYYPIALDDILPLFDYVPQIANTQVLANGNVPVYADITEGYDNYPVGDFQVTLVAANKTNIPPDTDPPALSYVQAGTLFTFTVSGTIPTGTVYTIAAYINYAYPTPPFFGTLATYTSLVGDTLNDVATGMYNYIVAHTPTLAGGNTGATFGAILPAGSSILHTDVVPPSPGAGTISTEKTHLYNETYIYGMVYVDEQNREAGVQTFSSPINTDNDFVVSTPNISFDGSDDIQTPVITATINHLPPDYAVAFYWVRRRQSIGNFVMYMTCDYQDGGDGFLYFCLANVEAYKLDNSQFIYGTVPITTESRIRILAGVVMQVYDGSVFTDDYQILGTVVRRLTGGATSADDRTFIKVNKPSTSVGGYSVNMLTMVYVPATQPTTAADSVYWEWGEKYDIYESGGVNYHRGKSQDQTASQTAIFEWDEGDVYFHDRKMYAQILAGLSPTDICNLPIMDANFSDFFLSAVNDNGRAQAIDINARQQENPVLIRFGGAYEAGTNVNNINRFAYLDFDEYDRMNGSIRKMFIDGRRLFVFQQFDVGVVPILTQIVRDTTGNPLEANSNILLNKITYPYHGKHGIGDTPESFAYSNGNKYIIDSNLGMPVRFGQNGAEELSVVYDCNSYFIDLLAAYGKGLDNGIVPAGQVYTGNPTVYGGFDNKDNKYIMCFEEINRYSNPTTLVYHQDAVTISFFETRGPMQGFESRYSYHPEGVVSLNNLLVSFKDGNLWRHNNTVLNNFYGVAYPSSATAVFAMKSPIKKKQLAIGYQSAANKVWYCPTITTNTINPQTGITQESSLIEGDFKLEETVITAALLRDKNSKADAQLALMEGDYLGGNYMIIKFEISATNAASSVTLVEPYLTDEVSQRNF